MKRHLRGMVRLMRASVVCWVISWVSPGRLGSQVLPVSDSVSWTFQSWQTESGLPQNHCTAVEQTPDGYLWLGTYNGLVRFDGKRFVVMNMGNTPGLKSSRVTSLALGEGGELWIGHDGGEISMMKGGRFGDPGWSDRFPGNNVLELKTGLGGVLWALQPRGELVRLPDGKRFWADQGTKSATSLSLGRDQEGRVYLLFGGRAYGVTAEGPRRIMGWEEGGYFLMRMCAGQGDVSMWLAGSGRLGKRRVETDHVEWEEAPWGSDPVTAMVATRGHGLWVGTQGRGVFVRGLEPGAAWTRWDRTRGLNHDWVRCLKEDNEGNVWIGTGGGLCVARPGFVNAVMAPRSFEGRTVLSLHAVKGGTLWMSSEGAGVARWKDGAWTTYGPKQGLDNPFAWSVISDPAGRVWVGTWGNGLFEWEAKEDRFVKVPGVVEEGVPIPAMAIGHEGSLWMGTGRGLVRLREGKVERWCEDWPRADVRTLAPMKDGSVWFGMSGGGLGRWKEGKLERWTREYGLASDYVWSLMPDEQNPGVLWIGTFGAGLVRLKEGRFTQVGEAQGLPNNVITHLTQDELGQLWLGTHGGIMRAQKEEVERCLDGVTKTVSFYVYGKADGLITTECSGGLQPSGCRTEDGRLWFPTAQGPVVLSPSRVKRNTFDPPVRMERFLVDGVVLAEGGDVPSGKEEAEGDGERPHRVRAGSHRFEFQYTALAFSAPDRVRFRHRLVGLESEWVEAGTRAVANYAYLAPGEYVFEVMATMGDGVWSRDPARLRFRLEPALWERRGVRVALALLLVAGVGGMVRVLTRRQYREQLERLERQRAVERERTRIAKDIHDDLGSSLTRITLLSQTARSDLDQPAKAAADLDRIHQTACELTRAMDEIVWAVNPRHDTADSLVSYLGTFAQAFLNDASLRCRLDVPLELPDVSISAEVRHNLFLACKEVLHNIVKHAKATEVHVGIRLDAQWMEVEIRDNGQGFDAKVSGESAKVEGDWIHNGISNIRQRLGELGGVCEWSGGPGEGTTARMRVPLRRAVG